MGHSMFIIIIRDVQIQFIFKKSIFGIIIYVVYLIIVTKMNLI